MTRQVPEFCIWILSTLSLKTEIRPRLRFSKKTILLPIISCWPIVQWQMLNKIFFFNCYFIHPLILCKKLFLNYSTLDFCIPKHCHGCRCPMLPCNQHAVCYNLGHLPWQCLSLHFWYSHHCYHQHPLCLQIPHHSS